MAMLTKQFKKFLKGNMKRRNLKTQPPQKKNFSGNFRQNPTLSIEKNEKWDQCHECKGFSHIAAECANTLKSSRDKKPMNIT